MIKTTIVSRRPFGGSPKFYAHAAKYSNIKEQDLLNYMMQNSQVGAAAVYGAVEAFKAVITTFVLNGHTVSIPNLGTFSVTLQTNSKGITVAPPADATTEAGKAQMKEFKKQLSNAVNGIKVRFTPSAKLRRSAKSAKFQGIVLQDDTAVENP